MKTVMNWAPTPAFLIFLIFNLVFLEIIFLHHHIDQAVRFFYKKNNAY